MAELTRRGFIVTSSAVGAAAAGGAAATQLIGTEGSEGRPPGLIPESLVVHVRDFATSELSLIVGTQEVVINDVVIVDKLLTAVDRHIGRE